MAKGNPPKIERNKDLVKKRLRNPGKWTFKALADHFHFKSRYTACEIFHRDKAKYSKA